MADKKANNNPEGKGGFGDHPESRNTQGAPRKNASMREVIQAGMEELVEVKMMEDGVEVTKSMPRKVALFERTFRDAMAGNASARKDILHYHDGLPMQSINLTGAMATGNITDLSPEEQAHLAEQISVVLGGTRKADGDGAAEPTDE